MKGDPQRMNPPGDPRRRALITGVTGQDGSYLAELLVAKGYQVYGMVRRTSTERLERLEGLAGKLEIVNGDLLDQTSLVRVLMESRPHEIYNLGAQSFVPTSWQEPVLTGEATGLAVTRLLEAVRQIAPEARIFQASSSEMFGKVREAPQNETTHFHPRSPYGVAKVYGHYAAINYRESYDLFVACGILFNHESPRRGLEFVTRKITRGAAAIALGLQKKLVLGNLDARRDWGHARDTVWAMWRMLQEEVADDFVIATGEMHTVRECCQEAFGVLGLAWEDHVETDPAFLRPAEVDLLCGDASKAARQLGWEPRTTFAEMIGEMVESDYRTLAARAEAGKVLPVPRLRAAAPDRASGTADPSLPRR